MKRVILFLSIIIIVPIFVIYIIGGGIDERKNKFILNNGNPLAFAHKGIPNSCAENSFEAFNQARHQGFIAIETDLNSTKDHRLIIFHDDSCQRLLKIESAFSDLNYIDIENKFLYQNGRITNNHIVSFDQLLSTFKDSLIIYLDIKKSSKTIADSLINYYKKYDIYNTVLVADASIFFLSYLKYKDPKIKTILEGFDAGKEWVYYIIPKNFKPDYYSSFLTGISHDHIDFLKRNNLLQNRIVYGINYANINKALSYGTQNIVVDFDTTIKKILQF